MIFEHADVAPRRRRLAQRAHDFAAGQVLRMEHAAMAMAALAAEVVFVLAAFLDAGELRAERDQLAHRVGAVAHDGFDRVPIAQAGAGAQRVVDVRFERVVDAPHAGDAALRVGGVGLGAARPWSAR